VYCYTPQANFVQKQLVVGEKTYIERGRRTSKIDCV
jgi:hypothetical protein